MPRVVRLDADAVFPRLVSVDAAAVVIADGSSAGCHVGITDLLGLLTLRGHDCFCPEFWALYPEPKLPQTTALRAEFGFKEDSNRVAGCARKDKRAGNNR